ncbi:MAG: hypothetical protein PHW76_02450 [Alphaproteobacteria bacterium]|nr:hypothetical protein [Alphaproteobacteria bacterium]
MGECVKKVKLRNGSEEDTRLVASVEFALGDLWNEGLRGKMAVYDLRKICEGLGQKVTPDTVRKLQDSTLVKEDGTVSPEIINIVVSSLEGEGFQTKLVSPLARPETPKSNKQITNEHG